MMFLLYKCGAFVPSFDVLDDLIDEVKVPKNNVVCRHGAATLAQLERLFDKSTRVRPLANKMKKRQGQLPEPWFDPGFFRLPQ